MNKSQALQSFWESFSLTAYDENSVPDNAVIPYITYSVSTDSLDNIVGLSGSLWYRSTSWENISLKAEEIADYIGMGGVLIPLDEGYLYLYRGSPFAQRLGDETDDMIKRIYFNINAEFFTR